MSAASQTTLVRAIGRWSLAALTINCIIASGVFGLPSVSSALVGNASPFAWLFAAIATALVIACFAEVSSRFDQTGGVYLYARTAFGRTIGITIARLGWLARLTAGAANTNLVIDYLLEFWPGIQATIPKILALAFLIGFPALVVHVCLHHDTSDRHFGATEIACYNTTNGGSRRNHAGSLGCDPYEHRSFGLLLWIFERQHSWLSANTFAMAEHGDRPSPMAKVHSRFRTPYLAIVLFAVLLYLFSVAGSFQWNVFISSMSRLIYYGSVCLALPVLRHKAGVPPAQFRLPMGELFAVLAAGISLLLFPRLDHSGLLVLAVLAVGAIVNSIWVFRHTRTTAAQLGN